MEILRQAWRVMENAFTAVSSDIYQLHMANIETELIINLTIV